MATHSSILAWKIPWREQPGGLQSTGQPRVGHDCVMEHSVRNVVLQAGISNKIQGALLSLRFR